jgi:hypothetical protein
VSEQATLEAEAPPPEPPRQSWARRRIRLLGILTGVIVVIGSTFVVLLMTRGSADDNPKNETKVPVAWARPLVSASGLVERSGVKITQVAVTGDGGLVDLRFTVVDANKAAALHDPAHPPAVVDQRSGLVVKDLLMSHAHTSPFKAGVTYYLVFNNPGNWVHRGDKVAVLLGNARVENVTVR